MVEQVNSHNLISIASSSHSSSQPSIRQFTQNKSIPPRQAEKIYHQLMRMIAKEYHPFRIVEEKFVNMLCAAYSLPTRKTLSQSLLPKIYRLEEKVNLKLDNAQAVCLTIDSWTSINNENFTAVTAHFVETNLSNTKLESALIGCIEHSERHTSEYLREFLKRFILKWNIHTKVTAIVSDNAANISSAIKSDWRHIPCFANTINLCIQGALIYINPTVNKVKHIVEHFKRSAQALKKFEEIQKQLNQPQLKLKQDVATRWNSTYEMLSRILILKETVITTIALLRSDLSLTDHDWAVIEAAVPILKLNN